MGSGVAVPGRGTHTVWMDGQVLWINKYKSTYLAKPSTAVQAWRGGRASQSGEEERAA